MACPGRRTATALTPAPPRAQPTVRQSAAFVLKDKRQVADHLERLRDATTADELIITTITHDHADRVRSYQLLADEWAKR